MFPRATLQQRAIQNRSSISNSSLSHQTSTTLSSASTNASVASYLQQTVASRQRENKNQTMDTTQINSDLGNQKLQKRKNYSRRDSLPPIQSHKYMNKSTKSYELKIQSQEPKVQHPYCEKIQFQSSSEEEQINLKKYKPRPLVNKSKLAEILKVSLTPLQNSVQIKEQWDQLIPLTLNLQINDLENTEEIRQPIDLICVVDGSGSMSEHNKIELVQKTLITLLKFLNDDDRLQIILFDHEAYFLTGLWRVNSENKKRFESIINGIQVFGCTNIPNGIAAALYQLENRKQKNNITSIFLLSDGLDPEAAQKMRQVFQNHKINDNFTINTFGFGQDHDSKLLSEISKLKDGNYYFIEQLDTLDECFMDAFGGLASVACKNILVSLESKNQDCKIFRTYGVKQQQKDGSYRKNFQYMMYGTQKDLVSEIFIPAGLKLPQGGQRSHDIAIANVQLTDIISGKVLTFKKLLKLDLYLPNETPPSESVDQDVQFNHLRVKSAESILMAKEFCDLKNYWSAKRQLDSMIRKIKKLPETEQRFQLLDELETQRQVCTEQEYKEKGASAMVQAEHQWMNQMSQPHRTKQKNSRSGSGSQSSYQNSTQLKYQSKIQSEKSSSD